MTFKKKRKVTRDIELSPVGGLQVYYIRMIDCRIGFLRVTESNTKKE